MNNPASEIARRLAERAEAVCRHYLNQGRREGRYWLVGDARNAPGRSLYVRLTDSPNGRGRAGKWTDAATGEHGDLLDIIALAEGHDRLGETLDEARRFLSLPTPEPSDGAGSHRPRSRAQAGSADAARRLFAASRSIAGSIAETYLRGRGLSDLRRHSALRFHPNCYHRPSVDDTPDTRTAWPALIAAVTDLNGWLTGVHRTWLDPQTIDKAPIVDPRRSMGDLLGHGVRFGTPGEVMAAGEGIETTLSLLQALPAMPMIAGLSAAHLAAIRFPQALRRLYIACDDDAAGGGALAILCERADDAGIILIPLRPRHGDFNEDLRRLGVDRLRAYLQPQLTPQDVAPFLPI